MRLLAPALLLAATLTTSLAKPLPIDMDEIQRRWSQGESEVCCTPLGPGCYISAWFRSLGKGRRGVRLPVCSPSFAHTPKPTLCTTQTNNGTCVFRHLSTQSTTPARPRPPGRSCGRIWRARISRTPLMSGLWRCGGLGIRSVLNRVRR